MDERKLAKIAMKRNQQGKKKKNEENQETMRKSIN